MKYSKKDIKVGLQFKHKKYGNNIYTIYKIIDNTAYINWKENRLGTSYNINTYINYFNRKIWLVINNHLNSDYEIF